MYVVFCALIPNFFGMAHINSMLNYACFLGFLSLGVTFVIATGGIDFSIGPVMFCCALISGYTFNNYGLPMIGTLLLSVLIGFLFGCFNGYMVSYWNVPPFIISMASMNIAKGLASVFTKTTTVSWPQIDQVGGWFRRLLKIGNFPVGLLIFLAVAVLCKVSDIDRLNGYDILFYGSSHDTLIHGIGNKLREKCHYIIIHPTFLL
jgi:ribose transport system permease protein